jgi:hypothetical protein
MHVPFKAHCCPTHTWHMYQYVGLIEWRVCCWYECGFATDNCDWVFDCCCSLDVGNWVEWGYADGGMLVVVTLPFLLVRRANCVMVCDCLEEIV